MLPCLARRWRGGALLFTAVWESDKVQWQYLLRVGKDACRDRRRGKRGGAGGPESVPPLCAHAPRRLEIDEAHSPRLAPWLRQFARPPSARVREKNWAPFVWNGSVFAE